MVHHFKELGIYALSVDVRKHIFDWSKGWPKEERYALTDQIRRSSRSVGANIAEAWAKRRFVRHFVSKLTDALGEVEETGVWLDVALECGYITSEEHEALSISCRKNAGGLVRMMRDPESWYGPSGLVSEDMEAYRILPPDGDPSTPSTPSTLSAPSTPE